MKKTIQTLVLSVATSTLLLAQAPATIPEKPEVIMVQGGSFQMGSNQETDEQPVHSVKKLFLSMKTLSFYIKITANSR